MGRLFDSGEIARLLGAISDDGALRVEAPLTYVDSGDHVTLGVDDGGVDHGSIAGLTDDDHAQYLNTTRHDITARHTLGSVVPHDTLASLTGRAHSSLTGVTSDLHHAQDHASRHHSGGADAMDHGSIAGLTGDDHAQYHTDARAVTWLLDQESWIAPNMINNWTSYGSGYNPAGYFKDGLGIVHLRGLIKSGTMNQPCFVLPAGYRPPYQELYPAFSSASPASVAKIIVYANGNVTPYQGGNQYFGLDGMTFRVA